MSGWSATRLLARDAFAYRQLLQMASSDPGFSPHGGSVASLDHYRRILEDPSSSDIFGVYDGSELAGMVSLGRLADRGTLFGLFVQVGWRRQGIGRCLVNAVIDACESHGCRSLQLTVAHDNMEAESLYSDLQFQLMHRDAESSQWVLDSDQFAGNTADD